MSPGPNVAITYCRLCNWLLRAAWMGQELLSTFAEELGSVTLIPDDTGGVFEVRIDGRLIWSRKEHGRFPEIKELKQIVKGNAICQRLMTVPGVGPNTAIRFVATLDDASRFRTAHDVQSYLGRTPGENSSSSRVCRTRLTKAGSPQMRWLLVQSAWVTRRCAPSHPIVKWATKIAERRGNQIASVALARKLAGILFALWRDSTTYNPLHEAT